MAMLRGMRYPGGKGQIFRQIINLMPQHEVYIETYLGMGAVLRNKAPVARSIGLDIDPEVCAKWATYPRADVEIFQLDALKFLDEFQFGGNELIYADPPYLPGARRRTRVYRFDYTAADHEALLATLRSLPCSVMVSGYDSALYRGYLGDWHRTEVPAGSHGERRCEIVWTNFQPPSVPYDLAFPGANFRERERIRKKQTRLRRRILGLSAIERALLLNWMRDMLSQAK